MLHPFNRQTQEEPPFCVNQSAICYPSSVRSILFCCLTAWTDPVKKKKTAFLFLRVVCLSSLHLRSETKRTQLRAILEGLGKTLSFALFESPSLLPRSLDRTFPGSFCPVSLSHVRGTLHATPQSFSHQHPPVGDGVFRC